MKGGSQIEEAKGGSQKGGRKIAIMERSKKQLVPKSGDKIQLLDPQTPNSTGLSP